MLRATDKTLEQIPFRVSLRERAEISLSISNIPECFVDSVQMTVSDGSTSSDYSLRIPETLRVQQMVSVIQPEDAAHLPTAICLIDGNVLFRHRLTFLAKNIAFGSAAYSARAVSDEIFLQALGSINFNAPPYDDIWSAQAMIKKIIELSGAPITPVFYFEDFEVLHITDFYNMPFIGMITDVMSGMPISVTYVSENTTTKMYFVDAIHKGRFNHRITGNVVTNVSANVTYIPPQERIWL